MSDQPSMELFQDISNQPPKKQHQPVLKTFERRRRVVSSFRACALLLVTTLDLTHSWCTCRRRFLKTLQHYPMMSVMISAAAPAHSKPAVHHPASTVQQHQQLYQATCQSVAGAVLYCEEQHCLVTCCSAAMCTPHARCCWPRCQKRGAKHIWHTHSRWLNILQR